MAGRSIHALGNPGVCKPCWFTSTSLTIPLADLDNPGGPDPAQLRHDERNQNATGGNSSNWKSTLSATAKLLLCTVRDSADAFPPLKSVAGGLCSILENYEV